MAPFLKLLELGLQLLDWLGKHTKRPELELSTPLTEADKPMPDKMPDTKVVANLNVSKPPLQVILDPVEPVDIEHTDELYPDWNTPERARHNVRALCDLGGLNHQQKEILTACVKEESGFLVNPKPNQNKDEHGKVWSTDWGIVQINDHFHIGPGKDFPSVDYVLTHPQVCVQWMINYYLSHGDLGAWVSYTSGAYKKHLPR